MSSSFRRRVGAVADVKELEYLAALHQTCAPLLRPDGTVSSLDVVRFLKSRMDFCVSHRDGKRLVRGFGGGVLSETVIQDILNELKEPEEQQHEQERLKKKIKVAQSLGGLAHKLRKEKKTDEDAQVKQMVKEQDLISFEPPPAGDDVGDDTADKHLSDKRQADLTSKDDVEDPNQNDDDDQQPEYLDLVQLVAIILIPTLARAGKEWNDARKPLVEQDDPLDPPTYEGIQGWFQKVQDTREKRHAAKKAAISESLRPKPTTILTDVFRVLLRSVDMDAPPALTAELVQKLLLAHGEPERACDKDLVERMVEAASTESGLLDEEAFVQALTADVQEWKVGSEDQQTTSIYDVFGFESYREMRIVEALQEEEANRNNQEDGSKHDTQDVNVKDDPNKTAVDDRGGKQADQGVDPKKAAVDNDCEKQDGLDVDVEEDPTVVESPKNVDKRPHEEDDKDDYYRPQSIMNIDYTVDTFSSEVLMVATFFFFMCTSLVYAILFQQIPAIDPQCGPDFGCILGDKVVTWMLFAVVLVLAGYLVIIPLSIGNSPYERSPWRNFFAFVAAMVITWIPYASVEAYKESIEPPYDTKPEQSVNESNYDGAQWVTRALGVLVSLLVLIQFLLSLIGNRNIRGSLFLSKFFVTSNVRGSARTKKAATRKINTILQNAHKLLPKQRESNATSAAGMNEQAMTNYVLNGESYQDCGGMFWTWKRVLTGSLFDEEGIWIMSRLLIIQTAQLFLFGFYTYSGVLLVDEIAEMAAKAQEDLRPGFPDWVYDIVPTPRQVRIALYPALGVAALVMLTLFLIYLPSYTGRIIQYRCGVLPSLKSTEFIKYRVAVDAVYTNIGNAIFAMIGAGFIFFALIGLVIFLFIWEFSRNFMTLLVAWLLGLVITIALKMVLVKYCRKRHYAGFYRLKPMGANLVVLALECWFIGLGGGVLVGRFTQFILAACFFVGRTDVPFLSKDVALFGYAFDYVPTNFVKDLLMHEAHRHPYMERLLAMYLMKLKNDSFCGEAGACWRQLFVVTLMPWFMKLRVFSDGRLEDYTELYNARRLERAQMAASSHKSISENVSIGHSLATEAPSTIAEESEESSVEEEEEKEEDAHEQHLETENVLDT